MVQRVVQRVVGGPVGGMAWKQGSMLGYRPSDNLVVRKTVVRVYHMEPNNRLGDGRGGEVHMDLTREEDSSAARVMHRKGLDMNMQMVGTSWWTYPVRGYIGGMVRWWAGWWTRLVMGWWVVGRTTVW